MPFPWPLHNRKREHCTSMHAQCFFPTTLLMQACVCAHCAHECTRACSFSRCHSSSRWCSFSSGPSLSCSESSPSSSSTPPSFGVSHLTILTKESMSCPATIRQAVGQGIGREKRRTSRPVEAPLAEVTTYHAEEGRVRHSFKGPACILDLEMAHLVSKLGPKKDPARHPAIIINRNPSKKRTVASGHDIISIFGMPACSPRTLNYIPGKSRAARVCILPEASEDGGVRVQVLVALRDAIPILVFRTHVHCDHGDGP